MIKIIIPGYGYGTSLLGCIKFNNATGRRDAYLLLKTHYSVNLLIKGLLEYIFPEMPSD
jgi:hypothetical protein